MTSIALAILSALAWSGAGTSRLIESGDRSPQSTPDRHNTAIPQHRNTAIPQYRNTEQAVHAPASRLGQSGDKSPQSIPDPRNTARPQYRNPPTQQSRSTAKPQDRNTATPHPNLLSFAVKRWHSTPDMRIEDAYKWLFHATLGGEHAVQDDSGPRAWLDSEWASLDKPLPNEPETVPLTPDGALIRVNLRPYKARGGDKEMLLAIFVESARAFHAGKEAFLREWRELGSELQAKTPCDRLSCADWKRLDAKAKNLGYPAIEHSEAYLKTYRPAYRVILGRLWVGR